ncbi:uncharacterized protein LOC110755710 [Prunus avium]|uniref:Uncharacterized protein LOC110755710 n=1 Tax=Prunus avium TaxID=42229 RepID=A0A6P5SFM8_PRUAV|nr:uncharacterized protein LOC110755710 [Prunus avium]
MASDESMTIRSCISMQEDEYDDDTTDDGYDHHPHLHNLSRLSMCTSRSSTYGAPDQDEIDDDVDGNYFYQGQHHDQDHDAQEQSGMSMYMSLLSMESFDADVDDEETLSSNDKRTKQVLLEAGLSSDSDKEPGCCYSLPATPPRPRTQASAPGGMFHYKHPNPMLVKEYASENEAQTLMSGDSKKRSRRRSRRRISSDNKENMNMMMRMGSNQLDHCHSFSGESEGGSGTGLVVITRPKGGRRSLCMDLEEVKACRDLGFELEHQHMLQEMPSRLSLSAPTPTLTVDTNTTCSSGGNSPIANWRISSPGDDPRDVKARLKVWAQAVALASTSRQGSGAD